jgi:hypothetical protein
MPGQYEFSGEQNVVIGSLGSKMRFVGLFAAVLGVINLIIALLVVVAIFRDRIPADWKAKSKEYMEKAKEKLPDDLKKQADEYSLDKVPAGNHSLWGIAINVGIVGLFYLLMGVWTRSAGESFEKIATTQGSDITNLMNGLNSLHKMYSLLYTLLVVTLVFGLIAIGLTLFQYFTGR